MQKLYWKIDNLLMQNEGYCPHVYEVAANGWRVLFYEDPKDRKKVYRFFTNLKPGNEKAKKYKETVKPIVDAYYNGKELLAIWKALLTWARLAVM